ncbi:MAG: ABC transporter permease [Oscillospiraceae bacterium]|nr:ABC transporter permease [Oscillospiraceae bacterium]
MKRFPVYFTLQLKRAAKLLPQMLAVTLLLAVLTALAGLMLSRMNAEDESKQLVRLAIVGNTEEGYLSEGLGLLESLDSSRFSIKLENMDREEAVRALRRGEIDAYAEIPDGWAEALWYGVHLPINYVSNSGGSDVGSQLMREIVTAISTLVLETENAVYGAQDFVYEQLDGDGMRAGDAVMWRYATAILDRDRLFQVKTIGAAGDLSYPGYYLCGIGILFLMLWSISCSPLFSGRSRELGQILGAEGLRAPAQVLAEFTGYLLLMLFGMLVAGGLLGALLKRFEIAIPELAALDKSEKTQLVFAALSVAAMLCALQFLLYELANSTVSGILLQFLNAAVQGYLAGCFYPASFFPEGLRAVGSLLPAGQGMRLLRGCLLRDSAAPGLGFVWLYLLIFLALSVFVRDRRNRA